MKVRKYLSGAMMAAALIALDQFTKFFISSNFSIGEEKKIFGDVFCLHYLENRGAAFGILQNKRIFFLILTALFLILIIYAYIRVPADKKYFPMRTILVLLFSGALGNACDRAYKGQVTDFFYFKLINFPVFNFADIYVVCAGILALIFVMFVYKDEDFAFMKKEKKIPGHGRDNI
jgi:signal peptidase II